MFLLSFYAALAASPADIKRILGPDPCAKPLHGPPFYLRVVPRSYLYFVESLGPTGDRPPGFKVNLTLGMHDDPPKEGYPFSAEIVDYGPDGVVDVASGEFRSTDPEGRHEFSVVASVVKGEQYRAFWQSMYDTAIGAYMGYCYS